MASVDDEDDGDQDGEMNTNSSLAESQPALSSSSSRSELIHAVDGQEDEEVASGTCTVLNCPSDIRLRRTNARGHKITIAVK